MRALLKEFNARASEIGFKHRLDGGCLCTYIPAEAKHIKFDTKDLGGWTELTFPPTGGQPVVLPAGTTKRAGFIDPPSPNVVCTLPPKLPRPEKPVIPTDPTVVPPLTPPTQPSVECQQPIWSKPAGTIIVEKRFPFDPLSSDKANNGLADYVNNQLQQDIDLVLNVWLAEFNTKCQLLNRGGKSKGAFEPEPSFTIETGDSGTGAQLFMVYRVKLKEQVKGKCVPK